MHVHSDLSISFDKEQKYIKGYKLVRNDHPGNIRRSDLCTYFRESVPVHCTSYLYLNECLLFEDFVNS